MPDPIVIRAGVWIPSDAMAMRAVRASGPGGQNVNKVSSKVELRVDVARIVGLDAGALARLRTACARAIDAQGRLVVTSQRTRDQHANLADASDKLRTLVARALVRPRTRRTTTPTRASVERRLADKRRHARTKSQRGRPRDD